MKINNPFNFALAAIALSVFVFSCKKSSSPSAPKVLTVTTFAGTGAQGSANGTGTAASFNSPSDVAIGSNGELYVGDWANNLVRTISLSSAAVSTYAGTGVAGLLNGTVASAEFNGTAHIVFDKQNNLYVADEENNVIREISSSGTVTTFAGSGVQGYQDGTLATAQFSHPEEMVFDANGDMYVADGQNYVIRKITMSSGMVSTFAGTGTQGYTDGPAATAVFNNVYGLAMDGSGNLYVPDIGNNVIRKITVSTATVSTFAGSGAQGFSNGPSASASFYYPIACTFDKQGNLYVADLFNNAIREISTAGMVSTYAGTGTQGSANGPATSATFYHPIAIAIDASGNLYIADEYNNEIRKIGLQ